jgi:hypothetical protein
MSYLEVLFVRHLQGNDISTTGTSAVATARASDGADDAVFDTTEEIGDARFNPALEPAYSVEGYGHFVGLSISLLGAA